MSNHVQREGSSLELIRERVLAEFGHHARITAEERITVGGIGGFFAREAFRVTVELPDSTGHSMHNMDLPTRVGLAALLADADSAEQLLVDDRPAIVDQPSTSSPSFAALLEQMVATTADPPAVEYRPVPPHPFPSYAQTAMLTTPYSHTTDLGNTNLGNTDLGSEISHLAAIDPPLLLEHPGDLVLCIGLRDDAHALAQRWAQTVGAERAELSSTTALPAIKALHAAVGSVMLTGRRDAAASRARGVETGTPVFVSATLEGGPASSVELRREHQLGTAALLCADQTWLVVDVSRKLEDTEAWVLACQSLLEIHGIVAVGLNETATPQSVEMLGLPVLWDSNG